MSAFYFFLICFLSIFGIKILSVFLSFKMNKSNEKYFSDIFIYRDEIIDSLVIALIIVVFAKLVSYIANDEMIIYLLSIVFVSFISSYYFLATPLRALLQKKQYLKDNELEKMLQEENVSYYIRIIKGKRNNAYATGFFPFTKIILIGEPLYKKMKPIELKAVVYHEIGHLKLGHITKMFFLNLLCTIFFMFLVIIRFKITEVYGFIGTFIEPILVILSGSLYGLLTFVVIPFIFQRRMELQADTFAARKVGVETYIQMLNTLNVLSGNKMIKGDVAHPSLQKRIENVLEIDS